MRLAHGHPRIDTRLPPVGTATLTPVGVQAKQQEAHERSQAAVNAIRQAQEVEVAEFNPNPNPNPNPNLNWRPKSANSRHLRGGRAAVRRCARTLGKWMAARRRKKKRGKEA